MPDNNPYQEHNVSDQKRQFRNSEQQAHHATRMQTIPSYATYCHPKRFPKRKFQTTNLTFVSQERNAGHPSLPRNPQLCSRFGLLSGLIGVQIRSSSQKFFRTEQGLGTMISFWRFSQKPGQRQTRNKRHIHRASPGSQNCQGFSLPQTPRSDASEPIPGVTDPFTRRQGFPTMKAILNG